MKQDFRRIWYITRAALFSTTIHGVLVAALVAGFLWPQSDTELERGVTEPIQAKAISNQEIIEQVEAQKKRLSEKARLAEDLEKLRKQQEEEQKRLETLETNRIKEEEQKRREEQKRLEEEKRKRAEQERLEEEARRLAEQERLQVERLLEEERLAEQKRLEEEKRKQAEQKRLEEEKRKQAEQKRLEEEKRKQAEQKRLEEEKRKQSEQKRLEEEKRKQSEQKRIEREAATALQALFNEIATAVEDKWRVTGKQGLKALIQVKVDRNGEVQVANVIESSGDRSFDESAEWAIKRASPLPFPKDPRYYEFISEFNFLFNPDG